MELYRKFVFKVQGKGEPEMDEVYKQPDSIDDITITCNSNFQFHLLFDKLPKRPSVEELGQVLTAKLGEVKAVIEDDELLVFSLEEFPVPYSEGRLKTKVVMTKTFPFHAEQIIEQEKQDVLQLNSNMELLNKVHYTVLITDMLASSLEYKTRCKILIHWIQSAASIFNELTAIWVPSAKKIISAKEIKARTSDDLLEFLFVGVNVRVFATETEGEFIVDTLGMNAIGRYDAEYRFKDITTQTAVEYAYYIASEILQYGEVAESINKIKGITGSDKDGEQEWLLEKANSTMPPQRRLVRVIAI